MATLLSQADYAKRRGVSQPRIFQYIQSGKIPKYCIKVLGKRKVIDADLADAELNRNLDQLRNRKKVRPPKPTKAQENAYDWATDTPEDTEEIIKDLRYIVKLAELDPTGLKIQYPEPGEDGILITYLNVSDDPTFQETLFLNIILNDPKEFQEVAEEEDLPDHHIALYEELKNRMDDK